jgi:regulator of sigma E protease
MVLTVVVFIAVLVGLIIAHELGHFVTAKAFHVEVKEFGIGFPPRIIGKQHGETLYSLNAIPLGGFVKLTGEDDPEAPRGLSGKPTGVRLLVLAAGSLMNFLVPLAMFALAFMVPHDTVVGKVTITEVAPGSPAAIAGIESGDTVISIDNHPINNTSDLQRYIQLNLGGEIEVVVEHADTTRETVRLTPRWRPPEGQGATGIAVNMLDASVIRRSESPARAAVLAVNTTVENFTLFKNGIISIAIGAQPLEVRGPVGIAQMTGEVARAGFSPLLEFAAFLSINLGLINILPLPALDGGRIAFVLLEKARHGRRVSVRTQGIVHMIGFIMLMAFMVAVTYNDIARIASGG